MPTASTLAKRLDKFNVPSYAVYFRKNAVQRLQKIESDIKTVISIFDVTKKSVGDSEIVSKDKERTAKTLSKIAPPRQGTTPVILRKLRNQKSHGQLEPLIKLPTDASTDLAGLREGANQNSTGPAFSSTLTTITEAEQRRKQRDISAFGPDVSDKLEWLENSSSQIYEVLMSPSKTLETAKEILAKNNFKSKEDVKDTGTNYKDWESRLGRESGENRRPEGETSDNYSANSTKLKLNMSNATINIDSEKLKGFTNRKPNAGRTRSASPSVKKESERKDVVVRPISQQIKSKSLVSSRKEKHTAERSPARQEKSPWSERRKSGSPERTEASKAVHKRDDDRQQWKERQSTNWRGAQVAEGESQRKIEVKGKSLAKVIRRKSDGSPSKESNEAENKSKSSPVQPKSPASQKSIKKEGEGTTELGVHELNRIIQKSNEKLEKMKMSKVLALDIAKQLKTKYEEIQQSKEELLEKLQKVEKDNERLTTEAKDAKNSKLAAKGKMEELEVDSKLVPVEEDERIKAIIKENAWLKTKVSELEKQRSEKSRQDKFADQFKYRRFLENRNSTKINDDQTKEELEKLMKEKALLLVKIDEYRCSLSDRNFKMEKLEEKILELQDEIQVHKTHLKQKTETLEDTNKELESIKKKSEDLEEQVKELRKNIENFDELHQNLMKQTTEYENQIKFCQAEVAKLKEENAKLKTDLENEKDSLLIKNKIIDDNQETIKQLREKSDEIKKMVKRNQSLERILHIEREEKLELQDAVERLKWRKEELKKKVKLLEGDLLLGPQEIVRDLQKTQTVLHELENQVQIKQKEWELHLQSLIREKEQACSVAEFATKKLMQTTNEFQKQSEAHKRLHQVLAENLKEKQKNIREVSRNELRQIAMDMNTGIKRTNCQAEKYQKLKPNKSIVKTPNWFDRKAMLHSVECYTNSSTNSNKSVHFDC